MHITTDYTVSTTELTCPIPQETMEFMSPHLLMISEHPEDTRLGGRVALLNRLIYVEAKEVNLVRKHITTYPETVVFWNVEKSGENAGLSEVLPSLLPPSRIFAITEHELAGYPHLHGKEAFGHHIQRRFQDPAAEIYSRLTHASFHFAPLGLRSFFQADIKVNSISIKNENQKRAAIEAIQKILTVKGVPGRLASLIAQGADELLLNAIFDAAISTERGLARHEGPRDANFELGPEESVTVELASSSKYLAICVSDPFGSLRRDQVNDALRPYFKNSPQGSEGQIMRGFGLHGVLKSGLSLAIHIQPGKRTDAVLFIPYVENYKDFRSSFRFFSLVSA